jgi:hypothetical protein
MPPTRQVDLDGQDVTVNSHLDVLHAHPSGRGSLRIAPPGGLSAHEVVAWNPFPGSTDDLVLRVLRPQLHRQSLSSGA